MSGYNYLNTAGKDYNEFARNPYRNVYQPIKPMGLRSIKHIDIVIIGAMILLWLLNGAFSYAYFITSNYNRYRFKSYKNG